MPSSELQSRMTSLPISWVPWIWQCGAEGGTIRRVSNKGCIYYEPNGDLGSLTCLTLPHNLGLSFSMTGINHQYDSNLSGITKVALDLSINCQLFKICKSALRMPQGTLCVLEMMQHSRLLNFIFLK